MAHLGHRAELMSGALGAVLAATGGKYVYSIGVADLGGFGTSFGYNDGTSPTGSITPSSFRGAAIRVAATDTTGFDFTLTLNGVLAQTFVGEVLVQGTDGSYRRYVASAADSFISGPSVSIWSWSTGNPLTAATPSPRALIIAF